MWIAFSKTAGQCFCASWIHQLAKKWRKTLIPTVLWLFYDFLSLKNDVFCSRLEVHWLKQQNLDPELDPLHWKKSWQKTPPAWPDVTDSLVRGTENFFDMKIELIRRVPTTKTEYFEIIGISRWFFVLPRRSFLTIFHQLSDEWIIKSSSSGTRSHDLQDYNPLLYHCATLPLWETMWQH